MQCYLDGGDYKAAMQVFEKIPTVRDKIIINNSVLLLLKVLNTFTLYFTFYFGLNFNFSLDSILILILIFLFLLLLIFYVILYLKSSYIYILQNRQMSQLPYIIISLEIQLRIFESRYVGTTRVR